MLDRMFEAIYQSSQRLIESGGFKRPSEGAEVATTVKKDLDRGLKFLKRLQFRDPKQTQYLEGLLSHLEGIFAEAHEVLDVYLENNPLPAPKPTKARDTWGSYSCTSGGYGSSC